MIHIDTSVVLEWQSREQCNLSDFNLTMLPQKSHIKVLAITQLSVLTKTIKNFLVNSSKAENKILDEKCKQKL